jgi:hypothetical protein
MFGDSASVILKDTLFMDTNDQNNATDIIGDSAPGILKDTVFMDTNDQNNVVNEVFIPPTSSLCKYIYICNI